MLGVACFIVICYESPKGNPDEEDRESITH